MVASESLAGPRNHRRLPSASVGGARLVIGAEPHLIAPVDFGPGRLRGPTESRVFLGKPPADGHGILLEGSAPWFLGGEAPPLQIPSHRPDRELALALRGDELLDGLPGPQGEGEPELIGAAAHDESDDE